MIELDEATHTYTVDGVVFPSVTQVLDPLNSFDRVPAHRLAFARKRGRAVHLATQYFDEGDLDLDTLDPILVPYVQAWERYLDESGFEVHAIEQKVHCPTWGYAGMLDRAGKINGDRCVIDIKVTADLSPITALQTAAYEAAYRTDKRRRPYRRFAVRLKPDGTYVAREFDEGFDLATFRAALTLHNWRHNHGVN